MLHPDVVQSVGFVVHKGDMTPRGTCFLVTLQSTEFSGLKHGYVVTARHVLIDDDGRQQDRCDIWMTNSEGTLRKEIEATYWEVDKDFDIAVAPWVKGELDRWYAAGIPHILYSSLGLVPSYGELVLYPGLVAPVRSMQDRGQPMVRAANIGFTNAENVAYGNRIAPKAHIIDCRSWYGFSGSPCWLVGPMPVMPKEPAPGVERLQQDERWEWAGDMVYVHGLWGMLVGYTAENPIHSIGVVIPIEDIVDLIERSDDLKKLREEETKEHAERVRQEREGNRIDAISAEGETAKPFARTDFLADLRRVTRRTDKPQSDPEGPGTSA